MQRFGTVCAILLIFGLLIHSAGGYTKYEQWEIPGYFKGFNTSIWSNVTGDVMLLTRAVLGLIALTDPQKARVDIAPVIAGTPTPDKQVTLGDLVVVKQILLGVASYP